MARTVRNDLTNKHFNNLWVVSRSHFKGTGKKPVVFYNCICKCGNAALVRGRNLISGHTKSCGCLHTKHGFSNKERLYQTWKNMRRRCNDPRNKRYKNYGGRGIKVCSEWNDYMNFRNWAYSNGYNDSLTIDRINHDGNYEPQNCRWVDFKIQANNMTINKLIKYQGKIFTLSQFAEYLNLPYKALQHRLARHWSIDRIVNTPLRGKKYGA